MRDKYKVCIYGGLGNQMFMYAFYKYLNKTSDSNVVPSYIAYFPNWHAISMGQPITYLDKIFNVDKIYDKSNVESVVFQFLKKMYFRFLKIQNYIRFEKKEFSYEKGIYLSNRKYFYGYFQSFLYADRVRDDLLKEFVLTKDLSEKNKRVLNQIKEKECTVSLHIRRGDYLSIGFDVLNEKYFKKAWKIITKQYPNAKPIIFSMDLDWCQNFLSFLPEPLYVSCVNVPMEEDMILMSKCDHNIIANSSYSWWSAYLNTNPDKIVVAPKSWGNLLKGREDDNDLLPEDWMKI